MSTISIPPCFPFERIRIIKQEVITNDEISRITAVPDQRYNPVCHVCGNGEQRIHRHEKRSIRDLNLGSTSVWINCAYRKIVCTLCNRIVVEDRGFFDPYQRVTRRLALYIHELCKILTVNDVARH